MARPRSKAELLDQANVNYERLMAFVEAFSIDEQEREFAMGTVEPKH